MPSDRQKPLAAHRCGSSFRELSQHQVQPALQFVHQSQGSAKVALSNKQQD